MSFDEVFKYVKSKKDPHSSIHKAGDITLGGSVPYGILSGIPRLDFSIGRPGLPAGRVVEYFGFEMCLDENTFIQYSIIDKKGKIQNSKGGSIKRLYYRFHHIKENVYTWQRKQTENCEYLAPSVNEEGRIVRNKIIDVVKTGIKPCFSLKTKFGNEISASGDHKFFNGEQYVKLKDLREGDTIYIHNNTRYAANKSNRPYRKEYLVKHHPEATEKVIDKKYKYFRIKKYRAVYEAFLNRLTLEEYLKRLNENDLEGLSFIPKGTCFHHIDENPYNNKIENLQIITPSEHNKQHALKNHNSLRYMIIPDEIVSINYVGKRNTYDLKMEFPYNNYIANNFVTHNSGKTTAALHALAQAQRAAGGGLYIDAEFAWDEDRAVDIGIDPYVNFAVSQVETIEGIFRQITYTVEGIIESSFDAPFVIIVDSVTAVTTEHEYEKEVGAVSKIGIDAKVIRDNMRKLMPKLSKSNVCLIFINHAISKVAATPYAKQSQSSGGHAIKFYSSLRCEFANAGQLKEKDKRTGQKININIEKLKKSRLVFPKISNVALMNETGFDLTEELFEAGKEHNLIERVNNMTYRVGDVEFTKADWPQFVEDKGGPNKLYDSFIQTGLDKGIIRGWNSEY